jgi:acyl carrier protein
MANQHAYVLDHTGHLAPIGIPGQLHIAGAGLARCYTNQPALTAERFPPNPYSPTPGQRLYTTGDIAHWQPDGTLHFNGRADRQIKIRGLRIELPEIEHTLTEFEPVRQAVVLVKQDAPGGPRLDAYLVLAEHHSIDQLQLRSQLSEHLPLHMIPSTFTVLEALPLNASGKLDLARLPEPELAAAAQRTPPETRTEQLLAGIWAELLAIDPGSISRPDSFFSLGGSSLQATQLISRIRDTFYLTLDPRQLFTHPELHQLAELVDATMRAEVAEEELRALEAEISGLSEEEIDRLLAEGSGS